MTLRLGDTAPDFEQDSSIGKIKFHEWIGDSWVVLFSHPADYTPVCTTELGMTAKLKSEFDKRNVKAIGLSVDPVDKHAGWIKDIEETQNACVGFPDHRGCGQKSCGSLRHDSSESVGNDDCPFAVHHRSEKESTPHHHLSHEYRPEF